MMRRFVIGAMLAMTGLAAGACGDPGAGDSPPDQASSTSLPQGYALRLDRPNRAPADFVTTANDGGLDVSTGPAGIVYRPDQVVDDQSYAVAARFTEIAAPVQHREGFGLFIGGQDLGGINQRYLYFLVRGDGRYLIKQRDGASTREVSNGWQASEAVRVATVAEGDVINELAIVVDNGRLRFSCNGVQVADMPVGDLTVQGVVGMRVNHNLRVRVQEFLVGPAS